jgi:hypothetical protein
LLQHANYKRNVESKTNNSPDGYITMVRQFHEGMTATVTEVGENSQPFSSRHKWSKKAYVPAATLFSMVFTALLADSFSERDSGIK